MFFVDSGKISLGYPPLFKKSAYYLLLCFLLRKTESHELNELFTRYLTDSRLMDERCVDMICSELGNGADRAVIHYNSIALGVTRAAVISVYL